jgi:drug/metabolite transporter (DMT)-like permease
MRLAKSASLILLIPPVMWAANAIVGRMAADLIAPMFFNFMRWLLVLLFLLPLAPWILRPGSGLLLHWKRYMVMGILSVSMYNSLQYLALHTSSAINVTLIAASMPVWMLVVGRLFYNSPIGGLKVVGAAASILGVVVVLVQGNLANLAQFKFVAGDLYILVAIIGWSIYSWMLKHTHEPARIRQDWAALLLAQVIYGLGFSGIFSVTEAIVWPQPTQWSWPLAAVLVFVAIGPAILAYRAWGEGVQRVGPTVAGFYANLTPLLTAVMSSLFLGEHPKIYHGVSFMLIALGIWLSSIGPKANRNMATSR